LLGRTQAAGWVDHITRGPRRDEGVQPGIATAHAPAGFVRRDAPRTPHIVADLLVGQLATPGGTGHRAGARATRNLQPLERRGQQLHALAMRQPALLIHHREQGMDVRSELAGRRAASCRGHQQVPPFDGASAVLAPANLHVELAVDHLPRDFGLILRNHMGLLQVSTATMRALLR
jgi:hypothetical protein